MNQSYPTADLGDLAVGRPVGEDVDDLGDGLPMPPCICGRKCDEDVFADTDLHVHGGTVYGEPALFVAYRGAVVAVEFDEDLYDCTKRNATGACIVPLVDIVHRLEDALHAAPEHSEQRDAAFFAMTMLFDKYAGDHWYYDSSDGTVKLVYGVPTSDDED